jgi:hypothetical protein
LLEKLEPKNQLSLIGSTAKHKYFPEQHFWGTDQAQTHNP